MALCSSLAVVCLESSTLCQMGGFHVVFVPCGWFPRHTVSVALLSLFLIRDTVLSFRSVFTVVVGSPSECSVESGEHVEAGSIDIKERNENHTCLTPSSSSPL
jgi:hypothetical protein